jgi:amidase
MKKIIFPPVFFILACKPTQKTVIPAWVPYDETEELAKNATNASPREYKLIQSKILDKMRLEKHSTTARYFFRKRLSKAKTLI